MKHKFYYIFLLFILMVMNSGCKFPDNIPDWQNISSFKLNKLEFGKTSLNKFKELTNYNKSEKIQNVITINLEPENKDYFKNVRVGFRNGKLDWIEFSLNKAIKMTDVVNVYGKPRDINSTYSEKLNYFDYDFFNISTDKSNILAKHITIFQIPKPIPAPIHLIANIPKLNALKNRDFLGLVPGYTLEADFNSKYPFLKPFQPDESSTKSLYILDKELGQSKSEYKLVQIYFKNGLLAWIDITPQCLSLQEFFKTSNNNNFKVEKLDEENLFYSNRIFALIVNKADKKIKKIGIFSSKNNID